MFRQIFNRWTLSVLVCLVLCVGSCLFFISGFEYEEFTPPEEDRQVIYGLIPIIADELNYTVLNDEAVPFSFGVCANPVVKDDNLIIWFSNLSEDSWLLIRAYSGDNIIGSSGLVKYGGYVESIEGDFDSDADIILKVLAYEPQLYYSNGTASVQVHIN